MSLPYDVARCVGRFGPGRNDPICPKRGQCRRYLQIAIDRDEGLPDYRNVIVMTHCISGPDFELTEFLPVNEKAPD